MLVMVVSKTLQVIMVLTAKITWLKWPQMQVTVGYSSFMVLEQVS